MTTDQKQLERVGRGNRKLIGSVSRDVSRDHGERTSGNEIRSNRAGTGGATRCLDADDAYVSAGDWALAPKKRAPTTTPQLIDGEGRIENVSGAYGSLGDSGYQVKKRSNFAILMAKLTKKNSGVDRELYTPLISTRRKRRLFAVVNRHGLA